MQNFLDGKIFENANCDKLEFKVFKKGIEKLFKK